MAGYGVRPLNRMKGEPSMKQEPHTPQGGRMPERIRQESPDLWREFESLTASIASGIMKEVLSTVIVC